MKKRIVLMVLALLLLVPLVSCAAEPAVTPGSGETEGTSSGGAAEGSSNSDETEGPQGGEAAAERIVIDTEECLLAITETTLGDEQSFTLKVRFENRSETETYQFGIPSAAVNGVQCFPYMSVTLAPGESDSREISITKEKEFKGNDVGAFTDVEVTFRVRKDKDWSSDGIALETVHIYPYGEEKAAAFVREAQPDDQILVDNEFFTLTVTGYEHDEKGNFIVYVYLVNKTDQIMYVEPRDAVLNGSEAVRASATPNVLAGKISFGLIQWGHTSLEEAGITEVEQLSFRLLVSNIEVYPQFVSVDETVTLYP